MKVSKKRNKELLARQVAWEGIGKADSSKIRERKGAGGYKRPGSLSGKK